MIISTNTIIHGITIINSISVTDISTNSINFIITTCSIYGVNINTTSINIIRGNTIINSKSRGITINIITIYINNSGVIINYNRVIVNNYLSLKSRKLCVAGFLTHFQGFLKSRKFGI